MKKIFLVAALLAAWGTRMQTANAEDLSFKMETDPVKSSTISSVPIFSETTPVTAITETQTVTSLMAWMPPAPVVATARANYVPWPVVAFGFGCGHPFVSGYYRGNYGRPVSRSHP